MSDARHYRATFQDVSGTQIVLAATGDTTLVTGKTDYAIYIQRIVVWIETDAAQSMAFNDSATTPIQIAKVTTSPGASTRWEFAYGDVGVKLTEAKDLIMNVSAAGLVGVVFWEGYLKQNDTLTL
jgi:hypothetical protein